MIASEVIYDLGVNHGEDTGFYLKKGFKVVGVEANPIIFARLYKEFEQEIANGQLILLNIGITAAAGIATFYVNEHNDHWSSFVESYGTRNGTKFHTEQIDCKTIGWLLQQYGLPRYLKIDIEGMDRAVLQQLTDTSGRPEFISVEEYGVNAIDDLHALGYNAYKLIPQRDKSQTKPPNPPREGKYFEKSFSSKDTGLFGNELPGEWTEYADFRSYFVNNIRREDYSYIGPQYEWYDIHCTKL